MINFERVYLIIKYFKILRKYYIINPKKLIFLPEPKIYLRLSYIKTKAFTSSISSGSKKYSEMFKSVVFVRNRIGNGYEIAIKK